MRISIHSGSDQHKVQDAKGEQSTPAKFHNLIVLETWDRPSYPDKHEAPEDHFTHEYGDVKNSFYHRA